MQRIKRHFTSGGGTISLITGGFRLTGDLTAINDAINDLIYQPPSAENVSVELTIVTTDNGNTGAGGVKTDTDVLDLEILPANSPPVIDSAPTAVSGDEEATIIVASSATTAITLSDPDLAGHSRWFVQGDDYFQQWSHRTCGTPTEQAALTNVVTGAHSLVFEGTEAQVEAVLDGLTYTGDTDFNGTDAVSILIGDQGNTGAGPLAGLFTFASVDVTVNAVNDDPTIT